MKKPSADLILGRMRRGWPDHRLMEPARNRNAKVSEMKVMEIWESYKGMSGASVKTSILNLLAKKHKVSYSIVLNIVYGNTWNRITGLPKRKKASK